MEIRIEGLTKTFVADGKPVRAIDGIDLTIPARSVFSLLGPSGCGKTTLLRCIVGLETPDDGEIRIGGEVVWSRARRISVPPEKRGLGMVFQTYAIWPHMNVFDNIAYPLQVRGAAREAIRAKVEHAMRFVQLEGLGARAATRLSGGQQQRVALARALVAEPKVILFDEPLSNLDPKLREETRKELKRFLGELRITAVYVTHDRVEALSLSDQVAVLRAGKVVEVGTPREIYLGARDRYVAEFVGRANQIPATILRRTEDQTIVATGMGELACGASEFPEGSRAVLCIRPEFVEVAPPGIGLAGRSAAGHIETLEFVGEACEALVRVGEERLLARLDPQSPAREGDAVRVRIDPRHCALLAE